MHSWLTQMITVSAPVISHPMNFIIAGQLAQTLHEPLSPWTPGKMEPTFPWLTLAAGGRFLGVRPRGCKASLLQWEPGKGNGEGVERPERWEKWSPNGAVCPPGCYKASCSSGASSPAWTLGLERQFSEEIKER